ncbi:MAG TPA: SRPBCC family protein [Polyangiaceae bacterium]
MLKKILAGSALASVLFAGVVAAQPDTFHIERSTTVRTAPEHVFSQVNDFRAWTAWSPWEKKDPAMKRSYAGPPAGVGARYTWAGNSEVGEGRMTIETSDAPSKIRIKLEFLAPFAATNEATYTFARVREGTRVTWSMDGKRGFVSKAFGLFLDAESFVGPDFERGLAAMKSAAEANAANAARTANATP